MKKISAAFFAAFLLFAVCSSQTPTINVDRLIEIQRQLRAPHIVTPTTVSEHTASRSGMITEPMVPLNFSGNQIIKSLKRSVVNSDSVSARWSFANKEVSFDDVVADLHSRLTNPHDSAFSRIESIHIVAEYLKFQGRWENSAVIANAFWNDTAFYARSFDLTSWNLSIHSTQCGQFATMGAQLLVAMGYFTYQDFRLVSFMGNATITGHVLLEANINGYYSVIDFDPGEPGLLFPYSGSPNGYASAWDLHNNPDLAIQANYHGVPWIPERMVIYPQIFAVDTPHAFSVNWQGMLSAERQKQKNDFLLPGYSTINSSIAKVVALLDMQDSIGNAALTQRYNTYVDMLQLGNNQYMDSIRNLMQYAWGVDDAWTDSLLYGNTHIGFYDSGLQGGQFVFPYPQIPVPTWDITIGQKSLVQMPLIILSASDSSQYGDTVGPFNVPLWQEHVSLSVDHTYFNHLSAVPEIGTTISCAVNAHVLSLTGEWQLDMSEGAVSIETEFELVDKVTTSIPITKSDEIEIYPNPTNDRINLTGYYGSIELSDVSGRVYHFSNVSGSISLHDLPKGVYILSFDGTPTKEKVVKL